MAGSEALGERADGRQVGEVERRDLEGSPRHAGRDALRRVVAHWSEPYDEFGVEIYERLDAHPWVICDTRWHTKDKGAEAPVPPRTSARGKRLCRGKRLGTRGRLPTPQPQPPETHPRSGLSVMVQSELCHRDS